MKSRSLKTFGLAVVGVFHPRDPFVSAIHVNMVHTSSAGSKKFHRGFKLNISPDVKFSSDAALVCKKGDVYTLTFISPKESVPNSVWEELDAEEQQLPFYQLNGVKARSVLLYRQMLYTHRIGWKMSCNSLKQLYKTKGFYDTPFTAIDPNAYIFQSYGLFTVEWLTQSDPILEFGRVPQEPASTQETMLREEFTNPFHITFLHSNYESQSLNIHLANEATQVPPETFSRIGVLLSARKIPWTLKNGRYKVPCEIMHTRNEYEFSADIELTFKLLWYVKLPFIIIMNPAHSVIENGDTCTLLFENSNIENVWILGISFLRVAYLMFEVVTEKNWSVRIIKTTDENGENIKTGT